MSYVIGLSYLSWVNGIVHDLYPALESGDLKKAKVGFADVVEVHRGVLPRVVLSDADVPVGDDLVTERCAVGVHTLFNNQGYTFNILFVLSLFLCFRPWIVFIVMWVSLLPCFVKSLCNVFAHLKVDLKAKPR